MLSTEEMLFALTSSSPAHYCGNWFSPSLLFSIFSCSFNQWNHEDHMLTQAKNGLLKHPHFSFLLISQVKNMNIYYFSSVRQFNINFHISHCHINFQYILQRIWPFKQLEVNLKYFHWIYRLQIIAKCHCYLMGSSPLNLSLKVHVFE